MKILFIFLFAFLSGCNILGQVNNLPAQRPDDLVLTYHFDGGMVNHSEDILFSADSCVISINEGGKRSRKRFKLNEKTLDDLYIRLKLEQFDKIEYKTEGQVSDRGGITIQLSWNKGRQNIKVDDAQNAFVKENWSKEWRSICNYIQSISRNEKIQHIF